MEKIDARIDDVRSIELDNAFYVEDGTWIESLTVSSGTDFDPATLIEDISGVSLFYTQEIPTGPTNLTIRRLTILANESYPFILGLVLRNEAIPNRILLQRDTFQVVITVRNWDRFRDLADNIQETLGAFELLSVNQIDEPGEPLDSGRLTEVLVTKLPEEQLAILETAYNRGYFEVPREASATDIAEEFDIAQSTMSERLRTAERNLLEIIYGPRES
ncbi:helix-turn-helix domain-containing protein [Haloferax mediterranei ATCC 33500]|uniref:Bacterio-opsin activator n=1 Tax=Haloferax mediterranei (strain ATCC 33500 / DSM 1411 / JCM 8866 / NBRC 14739 / NCIMB 2177 / R-4) TaxID=523841 RepID=I3R5Q0_HALMT|nr:helix-turn-helix domain-containing protein [Haloferax mediterranei]AFK19560.2 bacterio-opsin activator [Haloferax mediterranei ATCC 33500]AHZ22951.1 bacterio-opsin activator [Haloferax mediterranei ATCC 33500]ELZ99879.1 bacterio-opsin activator [Haloferax mediterranei ATCC 33500]MDX5987698.1 helix-turn-helix domain-containing protein [Haloferax mediterranei ATCC 33500]QCQ74183.1 helix-turn-helix domain-containing protein [Haloferax mediterranei ATCC 33500]